MLHEILLSLSGHPSPLLRAATTLSQDDLSATLNLSPSEASLLQPLAHLSSAHTTIASQSTLISASHPSVICRSVASSILSQHLRSFQQCLLQIESDILTKDSKMVGAYNIVPLTQVVSLVVGEWKRRMEFLEEVTGHMMGQQGREQCTGPKLMDLLRRELQTGYEEVEGLARELLAVAEGTWLREVGAWVVYGQLPQKGDGDFFIRRADRHTAGQGTADTGMTSQQEEEETKWEEEWVIEEYLLPGFVTPAAAASMLFIGRSLNQIRAKSVGDYSLRGKGHLSTQLERLAKLQHPLDAANFGRAIADIRRYLSRTTLQKLLPLTKVVETLGLLRDFFLLRKGEFAMALTQQADEKIRSRWKRAENLSWEKRDKMGNVTVKEGEVAAVLSRTWAAMGSMKGEYDDAGDEEDEGVELARELLRLTIAKRRVPSASGPAAVESGLATIADTPFRNLLFSVPVVLTLKIPSPLDLFLTQADLQTYTAINSYLLSLRRAHIRLTDLWKITSLRRHHPAPPGPPRGSTRGGRETVLLLRQRQTARSHILRNAWATASAAIFFLGETEAYLQTEVVAGLSDGFHRWLTTGKDDYHPQSQTDMNRPFAPKPPAQAPTNNNNQEEANDDDIWLNESNTSSPPPNASSLGLHDPETLSHAHRHYLRTLVSLLLLSRATFTDPLYELLVQIDQLVACVNRLHQVWQAADLEADVGVVDAFVDLAKEEKDVQEVLREVETKLKRGIEGLIAELRSLEGRHDQEDVVLGEGGEEMEMVMREKGEYVPRRVGGLGRLLMKLDFGSWFGGAGGDGAYGIGEGDVEVVGGNILVVRVG
ncbi:gamma-tubulin complex component protein [Triangularia verruculosa]|uniref:Spindle pole body component n=1 Tax=Triangularia verruculosa TaxID=2587418 RepID=A0AAN6XH28_9PEZI|nr:gamma-tubulin complex component protein [Triangularia verruculosa]